MSYTYESMRPTLFTEEGQTRFLAVRDEVGRLLEVSGAFIDLKAYATCGGGDSWDMLACVDRLVELGEIRKVSSIGARQHHVYVSGRSR